MWLHAFHEEKHEERFPYSEAGGQEVRETMVLARTALTGGGISPPVIVFNNMVASDEIVE